MLEKRGGWSSGGGGGEGNPKKRNEPTGDAGKAVFSCERAPFTLDLVEFEKKAGRQEHVQRDGSQPSGVDAGSRPDSNCPLSDIGEGLLPVFLLSKMAQIGIF